MKIIGNFEQTRCRSLVCPDIQTVNKNIFFFLRNFWKRNRLSFAATVMQLLRLSNHEVCISCDDTTVFSAVLFLRDKSAHEGDASLPVGITSGMKDEKRISSKADGTIFIPFIIFDSSKAFHFVRLDQSYGTSIWLSAMSNCKSDVHNLSRTRLNCLNSLLLPGLWRRCYETGWQIERHYAALRIRASYSEVSSSNPISSEMSVKKCFWYAFWRYKVHFPATNWLYATDRFFLYFSWILWMAKQVNIW